MILASLTLLASALLNRMRGTTEWMGKNEEAGDTHGLPGRPLWYVAPLLALLALIIHPGQYFAAAQLALAYLFWGSFAWGHLFGLGRYQPTDRGPSKLEAFLLKTARGNPHGAFLLRHAFAVPSLLLLIGPWALAFPVAVTAAYEAAWRVRPRTPIIVGELLTGCLWGSVILMI